jgi:hypothetical protein
MKIGIITYHSVYNFGANLQAHSTVGYLRNNGFEPIIINWIAQDLEAGYNKGNPEAQIEAHRNFVERYLPLTELCRTTDDVVRVIKEKNIQAILIGSDAVLQHKTLWSRLRFTKKGIQIKEKRTNTIFPNPFWGSFISDIDKNIPVSLMSASSQNMDYILIRGSLRKKIGNALLQFKHITVRDEWTQKMVSYFTKQKIVPEVTPDPVFGYNQNINEQVTKETILKKFDLPENYVLFSFKNKGVVSEEWLNSCQQILEEKKLTGVVLTMPGGVIFKNAPMKVISPPLCPLEWYALIKYSSGYVGENMHPVVVALHNSVPFYSFDFYGIINYKYFVNEKSSKIYHILEQAGFLENRVCTLYKQYTVPSPQKVIQLIQNFDTEKCSRFSQRQVEKYNKMMKQLTSF